MQKIVSKINLSYHYDASHKSAHYTLDGIRYINNGEFAECIDKHIRGYAPIKDSNTAFDIDSDIHELNLSVKSARASLTDRKLADNKTDFIKSYFDKVHSKLFDWVVIIDDMVTIYTMTKAEFETFTNEFVQWDNYSKKARFGITSSKMLAWLDSQVV